MSLYPFVLMAFLSQVGFTGSRMSLVLQANAMDAGWRYLYAMTTVGSLIALLFSIAIGRYADRAPPLRPVLAGAVLMSAALLAPAFVQGAVTLVVVSAVLGFSLLLVVLPLQVLVGASGAPENRVRNYVVLIIAWHAANFLGPTAAGWLIDFHGYSAAYFVSALFAFSPVAILALKPGLQRPTIAVQPHPGEARGSVLDLVRLPSLRSVIIAAAVLGSARDVFDSYLPAYGQSIGLSSAVIGNIVSASSLGVFVMLLALPLLVKKTGEARILFCAVFVAAGCLLLMLLTRNALALGAVAFLLGLAFGSAWPLIMSLTYALAPPDRRTEAFGLSKTVAYAVHLAEPLVFRGIGYAILCASHCVLLAGSGALLRKVAEPVPKPAEP